VAIFRALAGDYALYRPGYSPSVITALLALVGRPLAEVDAADVGVEMGILTMMLAAHGRRSNMAAEPNDEMRRRGNTRISDAGHYLGVLVVARRQGLPVSPSIL